MTRVLIIGATSAIAQAVAARYADDGAALFLVARSAEKLRAAADDLRVRGAARVESAVLDVRDADRHAATVEAAFESFGGFERVLVAHGTLPDQAAVEQSAEAALEAMGVNLLSVVSLLTPIANRFEAQHSGCIAVIGSVAGDRGRRSNYVYGAAKGGLDVFLAGLRHRLHRAGVRVVTIKPGFVDTPMTVALPKSPLFASPERVGRRIHRAMERSNGVVYAPGFWRPIMVGVRAVPGALFHRLPL